MDHSLLHSDLLNIFTEKTKQDIISDITKIKNIEEFSNISFSEKQKEFINYPHIINSKVRASFGSGKTRCIIGRIMYLVRNNLMHKDNIFVLTFSRFTYNDFILKIKSIVPNYEQYFNINNIMTLDSLAKSVLVKENISKSQNVEILSICFNALLKNKTTEEIKKMYKVSQIKLLFFDEAQDSNKTNIETIETLMKKNDTIVTLVGDISQTIYQFRGSSHDFFNNFEGKEFILNENYRSSGNIVKFTNFMRPHKDIEMLPYNKLGNKVYVKYDKRAVIDFELITFLKSYTTLTGKTLDNIAILSPTRGVGSVKNIGLAYISNLLHSNGLPFEQFYDEFNKVSNKYNKKDYTKTIGKVNLMTYTASKGLEWDTVILIDFQLNLFNILPTKKQYNEHLYLLTVAASRAINELKIYCYSSSKLHPIIESVSDKSCYISNVDINPKKFILASDEIKESNNNITELLNFLTPYQLNDIDDIFQKVIINKRIFGSYNKIDREGNEILLGNYCEELFTLQINIYRNQPIKQYKIIDSIINDDFIVLNDDDYVLVNDFLKNKLIPSWHIYDNIKHNIDPIVKKIIDTSFNRKIAFTENNICNEKYKYIIDENRDIISDIYDKYLNTTNWKKSFAKLFYLVVVMYSFKNGHYFHIVNRAESKIFLRTKFKSMFFNMGKYAKKYKNKNIYTNIEYSTSLVYKPLNLYGKTDIILFDKKNREMIVELKCVKELSIKFYVQLFFYNLVRSINKNNIMKIYSTTYKIINFYTGLEHKISLSIRQDKLFELLNILADAGNLKFNNLEIVYDLETDGLIKDGVVPNILELAIKDLHTESIIMHSYVYNKNIPNEITKINGITDSMLVNAPRIDIVKSSLHHIFRNVESCTIYGHNIIMFDKIISDYYGLFNFKKEDMDFNKISYIDTLALLPAILKTKYDYTNTSRKQTEIFKYLFKKEQDNSHSAIGDVTGLIKIIKYLLH